MTQKNKNKNKRIRTHVFAVLVLLIFSSFITWYFLSSKQPLILKDQVSESGIVLEFGETEISQNPKDYLSSRSEQEYLENAVIDISNINFAEVGMYELIIEYAGETVGVDVRIVDTTSPKVTTETIRFAASSNYTIEDLEKLFIVSDLSSYEMSIESDCNFDVEGIYNVTASVVDTHGNETIENMVVEIVAAPSLSGHALISPSEGRQVDTGDVLVYVSKVGIKLSENYVPIDLVSVGSYGTWGSIKSVVLEAYIPMYEAALTEGIAYTIVSPYRDYELQLSLFNGYAERDGVEEANTYSALPGTSEHQTGYAIDVTTANLGYQLSSKMGDMPEGIWLENNAHNYGFIIRYPEGKTHITGYIYEPWHLRYVGVDVATEIFEKDITFDEYMGAY